MPGLPLVQLSHTTTARRQRMTKLATITTASMARGMRSAATPLDSESSAIADITPAGLIGRINRPRTRPNTRAHGATLDRCWNMGIRFREDDVIGSDHGRTIRELH